MIVALGRGFAAAVVVTVSVAVGASAQVEGNLGGLTAENVKKYLEPLPDAFGAGLNTSIFHSGHVPMVGINWSIGLEAMAVAFDEDLTSYTPTHPAGFNPANPGTEVPTVTGDTEAVGVAGEAGTELVYPGGLDIENFALAVPQITVGSFMGTRGVLRYIALDLGDTDIGEIELFGIGAQHSISQYFVALPVDVAAGVMYQSLNVGNDMIKSSALAFRLTGSRSFGTLEPYVGLGLDNYSFEVNYESDLDGSDITVEFDGTNDVHMTAGVNVNFALVHFHAELTQAATTSAAVGLRVGL